MTRKHCDRCDNVLIGNEQSAIELIGNDSGVGEFCVTVIVEQPMTKRRLELCTPCMQYLVNNRGVNIKL